MNDRLGALIEVAYALDGAAPAWLAAVVRAAKAVLGRGVIGNLVERRSDGSLGSAHVVLEGVAERWRTTLHRTAARMSPAELERRFATSVAVERGVVSISARGDDRSAVLLDAPIEGSASPDLLAMAERIAHHVAAGLRLRAGPPVLDDAESAWRALLDGRLALVDRFDRDGRRFVVVRGATPEERGALTLRERQVLASVARGHTNKRIALDLGVSESTVSAALRGAAKKLGVRSRVELVRILGPPREDVSCRS